MLIICVLCLILLGGTIPWRVSAQECPDSISLGWITPVNYARPLVCEIESSLIRVANGYGRTHPEYMLENSDKNWSAYLNVNLGVRLPIWSGRLPRNWYIAVDIPIYFHLWLDLQSISAPVLNTDYRFAVGQVKFLKQYYNKKIRNLSLRIAPYCHESTHIGDELTVRRAYPEVPITRVNVTYEYSEIAACINDPNGTRKTNHAAKLGIMIRNPFADSWYSIYPDETEEELEVDTKMSNFTEVYAEYEWQRAQGWATRKNILNVLSAEFRVRPRYTYPILVKTNNPDEPYTLRERKGEYRPCFNIFYGWKFYPKSKKLNNSLGVYLNGYYGIVPWGQFRNIPHYAYLGFSIVMDK